MRSAAGRSLAALTVAALAVLAGPPAAQAATTTCTGTIEHTRVEGDLVVPAEASCRLENVAVTGRLVLADGAAGARLVRSEVKGATVVGGVTTLAGDRATFHDVVLEDAWAVTFLDVTVRGDLSGTVEFVALTRAHVLGDVGVTQGASGSGTYGIAGFWDTDVDGAVRASELKFVARGLATGGDLLISDATLGAGDNSVAVSICGFDAGGAVRIERSHWVVAVNVHPYGDSFGCVDPGGQAASFTIADNPHSVAAGGFTVLGDLVCTNNTGPLGVQTAGVVVLGNRVGQCA